MPYRILIMGLSGSGKTTIAKNIVDLLKKHNKTVTWLNADVIREQYNDWDFSYKGRMRQSKRLRKVADNTTTDFVICDFIAPIKESRLNFSADYIVWMDTISKSQYEDTDQLFTPPSKFNYVVTEHNNDLHLPNILHSVLGKKKPFNVLPNIQIPENFYREAMYSGMDSLSLCFDKNHFIDYPKQISYKYNSRGFRDSEWPTTNLHDAIWCFGDSFTAGLGQPQHETWPALLQQKTNTKTINISLDGASTNWIARHVLYVLQEIRPKNIVIQWTYLPRRESLNTHLSDMDRRVQSRVKSFSQDIENFVECLHTIDNANVCTNIIHSWIPRFYPVDREIFIEIIKTYFGIELNTINNIERLDIARDYHHYDIKTATAYVNSYIKLLVN